MLLHSLPSVLHGPRLASPWVHPLAPHSSPSGLPAASRCEHSAHDTHHRGGRHLGPGGKGLAQVSRKAAWLLPGQRSAHLVWGGWTPPFPQNLFGVPSLRHCLEEAPAPCPSPRHPRRPSVARPLPRPPCDQRAGEAEGRTRRKLPRTNIVSRIQAPRLLRASGDGALMAILGLPRGCRSLGSGNIPQVRLTSARKGWGRAARSGEPGV